MSNSRIGDMVLSFAAFFQIAVLMFKELLVAANLVQEEYFRLTGILLAAIPMIPAIYYVMRRSLVLAAGTYLLAFFVILSTLVFFTANKEYIISEIPSESGAFYLLFINIPSFLCIASIRDIANLKRTMLLMSFLIFALGILYCYFLWVGKISYMSYSMTFSYYLLLPALVFVSQRNMLFIMLFIVIFIMMVMLGSRGALVAAFMYVFFIIMVDRKRRSLILSSSFLIAIIFGSLISLFLGFTNKTGVSSRSVDMFEQGDFIDPTGRLWYYETARNSILDSPILGHGLFGDRLILDGSYCHNIFLEIFHNFGLLIGSGIILLILFISVRVYRQSGTENRILLLMFFSYSIIPLLASASYLEDPKFGIYIGSLMLLSKYGAAGAHH